MSRECSEYCPRSGNLASKSSNLADFSATRRKPMEWNRFRYILRIASWRTRRGRRAHEEPRRPGRCVTGPAGAQPGRSVFQSARPSRSEPIVGSDRTADIDHPRPRVPTRPCPVPTDAARIRIGPAGSSIRTPGVVSTDSGTRCQSKSRRRRPSSRTRMAVPRRALSYSQSVQLEKYRSAGVFIPNSNENATMICVNKRLLSRVERLTKREERRIIKG